jgi:hypothetical protein
MITQLKFGKKPATKDSRDLLFANYRTITPILPSHPAQFGHETLIQAWQMLGNGPDDSVSPGFQGAGDCVWAGGDHETMLWTTEGGNPATFTGANAISDYSAVTDYNPADPGTDQGTDTRVALKYRKNTGLIDANGNRHKIGAYLALELGNMNQLLEALYVCDAVGIGIQFPSSAMAQFNAGQPWDPVPGATIDGGHYIPLMAVRNNLVVVTWAQLQQMTVAFYQQYCDEVWGILSQEFLDKGVSPEGFNLSQVQADLAALTSLQSS